MMGNNNGNMFNQNSPVFNAFGGFQNFMQQFQGFMNGMKGMNQQQKLQSGEISQSDFDNVASMANQMLGGNNQRM